jgi:hypothetical protein
MLDLTVHIESTLGKRVVNLHPIGRGYTPAQRMVVSFADGSSLFSKRGTSPLTVEWLRQEKRIYETLTGSFMARYLGWIEDDYPILLLEDLSHAHWPPPWREDQIRQVVGTLLHLWGSSLSDIPKLVDLTDKYNGWIQVANDPTPFLSLGIASASWLGAALPILLAIDGAQVVAGESLLHLDLRSDNICILDGRVILVDWNLVCLGNPDFDLGCWLPSLETEGGPPPEIVLPGAGDIAALVSGFFAARAGLPTIPEAPNVRHIQRAQLKSALPWATRTLGLPPLDGK